MAFIPDSALRRKRELSYAARDVYEALCAFADPYTGIVEARYASNARLVEWTGFKLGSVKNALTELRKSGWIEEREGRVFLLVGTFLGGVEKARPSPTNDGASLRNDDSQPVETPQPSFSNDAPSLGNDAPSLRSDAPSPTNDATYTGVTSPVNQPIDQTINQPDGDDARAPTGKAKREGKTGPPDGFPLTPDLLSWAAEHAPHVNLALETDAFLDWNRRKRKRRTDADWKLAWKNWMRNAVKFAARDGTAQKAVPVRRSNVDRSMDAVRERIAELEVKKLCSTNSAPT